MTVQDLRPNSQDTSAFYLRNIYGVLAEPNVTRASIPPPVAKLPPFSAPRYAVWVNSLWFLSLVMSVSCALWATSLQQWARRYIRLSQPARCSPETRARMRAFFSNGVGKMHIPWAVEGLPTLLHLSLFLFFGGLVIFLFNIDHNVFTCVVWWIGLFSMVYGLITLLPFIRQDSPYYTPLSIPAWFPYAGIRYVTYKVLAFITHRYGSHETWMRHRDLTDRYRTWMLGGVEKTVEKTASERSLKIDIGILDWTISALGDDDSLEKFIEAIPGFFNSNLVDDLQEHLPFEISRRLSDAMNGFLCRTLSSNSVTDSVKLCRLDISLNAISCVRVSDISSILGNILFHRWDQVPKTVEIWHTLARWCTSNDQRTAQYAQGIIARVLATVRERDDRWVELAARIFGIPERDLRDYITHGDDSVSLAILIHVTRRAIRSVPVWEISAAFIRFNIHNTLSGLQHDFCTLWNELVQEAKNQGPGTTPVLILQRIRRLYIALHQGTDAALSPWRQPSSCPLCDIASHRRDSITHFSVPLLTRPAHSFDVSPHHSTSDDSTVSCPVKQASTTTGPPSPSYPTIPSEIGDSSQAPATTSPALSIPTSSCPTNVSPPGAVAATLQDISPAATLSHPLGGTMQQGVVAPCAGSEMLSTVSTPAPAPTLAPVPAFTPPVLNKSLESCDAGAASTPNPLLPASSVVGFSIVAPPPLPFSPNAKSLGLFSTTTPSRPIGNATLFRLCARGLINTRSMSFANAVLQLLVHSPPFGNLFREPGALKGQREAGQAGGGGGGGVTPLVDATMRFFEEFMLKEELSPAQQPPQEAAGGKPSEDEETKIEYNAGDSFEPMYLYGAMKEKRQLKTLLVRSRAT